MNIKLYVLFVLFNLLFFVVNYANSQISSNSLPKNTTEAFDEAEIDKVGRSLQGQIEGALSHAVGQVSKNVVNELRFGRHLVRNSERGEIIIAAAINLQQKIDAHSSLRFIVDYANRDYAEAQNILGFFHEYGLHGFAKDMNKARRYYTLAAQKGYAAASLNLALIELYGKGGRASNPQESLKELTRARGFGVDSSSRVCGLGAFVANRVDKTQVLPFAQNCTSRLARMALAMQRPQLTLAERIDDLKGSYSAGVMDGLYAIIDITSRLTTPEAIIQRCRYTYVIEALRGKLPANPVCNGDNGTKAFVVMEAQSLEMQRQSSGVHLSWAVPYLPMSAMDEAYFAPAIKAGGQK